VMLSRRKKLHHNCSTPILFIPWILFHIPK